MSICARRIWLRVHLYIGLLFGVVIVVMGLTGSIIVWHRELDELLNPDLLLANAQGPQHTLDEIVAAAQRAFPGHRIERLYRPEGQPGHAYYVWLAGQSADNKNSRHISVYVDPYTLKMLGHRGRGEFGLDQRLIVQAIYLLHYTLLLGAPIGRNIVGFMGVFLMFTVLIGIYLWRPRERSWRNAFTIKKSASPARFNFDLHRTCGIYSALVLLVSAFSGVYLVFPEYVKAALHPLAQVSNSLPKTYEVGTPADPQPIDLQAAVRIAQDRFPDARWQVLMLPDERRPVYQVRMLQPGEVRERLGTTYVSIDPHSGRIVHVRDPLHGAAGDAFLEWLFPLHNGEALGLGGRILITVTGLVPLLLVVTGTVIWVGKRRSKAVERNRRAAAMCAAVSSASDSH